MPVSEMMIENVPNMEKEWDLQVQELHRHHQKQPSPWHTMVKLAKLNTKILKHTQEKCHVTLKGFPSDLELISHQKPCKLGMERQSWSKRKCQHSIQYPTDRFLYTRVKYRPSKQKWNDYATISPALQMILEEVLHTEIERINCHNERMWR